MQLLVIRHAYAGDRVTFAATGVDDKLRPLTREGRRGMRYAARELHHLVPKLDVLATSPLVRAVETAEIVANEYGALSWEIWPELTHGAHVWMVVDRLCGLWGNGVRVAVVGHEPDLSDLVSWLISGRSESFAELAKGAACLLEFDSPPGAGGGRLLWTRTP